MSVLPTPVVRSFIAQLGVTPASDPGRFDALQRELDAWWAEGLSCRAFVAAHQPGIGDSARYGLNPPMTTRDAYKQVIARMRPCP